MNAHPRSLLAWWDQAACKGTSWDLWRPPSKHGRSEDHDAIRYAKAAEICARCPVFSECRADADRYPDEAFRAGWSAADRERQNGGRW